LILFPVWYHTKGMNVQKNSQERHYRSCIPAAALLVLPVMAAFALLPPAAPAQDTPPAGEKNIARATLDNGLEVVVVRNTLSPVAATVVSYKVGADESPAGFPGTAHALEHMMFRGSPGLSAGQLANITAAMGGMFNALTRQSATQYFFTVPAADLEIALQVEAARMQGILGREEAWNQERGAMLQEVARNHSIPEYVLYTRLREALFKGTPYEQDALGTRTSLEKTTAGMLGRFHNAWYVPNNAVLVVAGDVDPQDTLEKIGRLFGEIPGRDVPGRPGVDLRPVKQQTIRLKTDKPYGSVVTAMRMPGYSSPDYAAARVFSDILNNPRGVLYALVPQGKALDTGFEMDTYPEAGMGYAVALFPQGSDPQDLERELKEVLSRLAHDGVSEEMVAAAKRRTMTSVELEKNSVTGLAMAWSTALAVEGRTSPEEILDAIEKVSPQDVNRLARACLDLDSSVTGILVPEPSGGPMSSSDSFGGLEPFTPESVKTVALPPWAEKTLERLSVPESRVSPVVSTLPNGINLIVQPESVSETVSVYGHVKNTPELQAPKGREGVNEVLDNLFSYGTTSLDREEFQRALDGIGAFAAPGADFTLQVLAGHVERGMELLADNELRPALPEKAFLTVRRQVAATVAGRLKSPEYLAERAVQKAIYPENDPTLRQATPETVASLSLNEVRDYYRRVFRPDMTTIVVIGRITPEKARALVEKHFGGWEVPQAPKPDVLLPAVPLNGPSHTRVPNESRVQDRVMLAQTLGLTRSHPDYYALQLGNHVLGGAFYATRLYRDLRERAGLVYHVSSYFDMSQRRGRYTVEYACDPSNAGQARAIVERNLEDMRKKPVTPDELLRAKALLLRKIPLSESSVRSIALGFIHRTRLDLPLDEPVRAAHRYLGLSAPEVRDAFARWVRIDDLVQVVEGPASP